MAIKKFNSFDKTQVFTETKTLPKGGYVLKILGASIDQFPSGDEYVKLSCDIAEGDYAGFYEQKYRNNVNEDKKWSCIYRLGIPKDDGSERDGWTARRFKTFTVDLEESNSGYHFDWDEQKFKGKLIGGLFNTKEFESDHGIVSFTNLARLCSVEAIRSGSYKLPPDKLIERKVDDGFQDAGSMLDNSPLPFD